MDDVGYPMGDHNLLMVFDIISNCHSSHHYHPPLPIISMVTVITPSPSSRPEFTSSLVQAIRFILVERYWVIHFHMQECVLHWSVDVAELVLLAFQIRPMAALGEISVPHRPRSDLCGEKRLDALQLACFRC
jgi:hypothetical protein